MPDPPNGTTIDRLKVERMRRVDEDIHAKLVTQFDEPGFWNTVEALHKTGLILPPVVNMEIRLSNMDKK